MTEEWAKRKLAAILSADVKGYSRLMGEDELATIDTLKKYRKVMSDLMRRYRGRIVDSPGDNVLAEFSSVVDAVECAVEVQKELKQRNEELAENRRMQFRIGVNLGDVVEDGDRIYGDGINIAARIEGLASEGGICISGTAYDQIGNKLALGYEYLGQQAVKNIEKPVRVYRVLTEPDTVGKVFPEKSPEPRRWRWLALLAVVLIVGVAVSMLFHYYYRSIQTSQEIKNLEAPMRGQASLAVLPFVNMSGDEEQEYFSDGITNDIITDLSKFRQLAVIASNSVFTYKGKPVKVQEVGRELDVQYVLEGTVQRASDRVRINAQLIDTTTGHHLWAERYDRDLKDLFDLQDEIVQTIVGKLAVKIDTTERKRAMRKKTQSLEAYDYVLRGLEYLGSRMRSENIKARQMFEKAIELEPDFASAYVGLARTYVLQVSHGWTEFPAQALEQAEDLTRKALSLDGSNASAYSLLGYIYINMARYDLAITEFHRAIELNPYDADAQGLLGHVMIWYGRLDDAIHALETARRFDPNMSAGSFMFLGIGYYLRGHYDDAIRVLKEGVSRKPDFAGTHIALSAAYAQSGRTEDSAREREEVLRLDPFFEVDNYGTAFRNQADREAIIEGLRKAGLK